MKRTPALPARWLVTDERLGGAAVDDPLWHTLGRLRAGDGILFRHYALDGPTRRALLARIAKVARRKRLILVVSSPPPGMSARNRHWPAHAAGRGARAPGLQTAAAHDLRELVRATRAGANLLFLSPVFATRSHPGGRVLGPVRFGLAAQAARRASRSPAPIIALGGMDPQRGQRMRALGSDGWAGIDAWLGPRDRF